MQKSAALKGMSAGSRNLSVEFWRFVFTALVCVYHLDIFYAQRNTLVCGVCAVEFFFILSGFFIARTAKRDIGESGEAYTPAMARSAALSFVVKKLKAIYPILIIVFLLGIVLPAWTSYGGFWDMLQNSEWDLLLLIGTPFGFMGSNVANIPLWFLTVLLLVGYTATYAMHRHFDFVSFIAPVVGVLSMAYFAYNSEKMIDHDILMGFVSAGVVRGVAGVSLGIAVFGLYERLKKIKFGIIAKILLSLLEFYSIYRFFALTLGQPIGLDNFRRIVYIMLIILLSMLNVTALARLLNNRVSKWLGSITLPMYMSHYVIITSYFLLMQLIKNGLMRHVRDSALISKVWSFLQETGSYYGGPLAAKYLTWKDAALYLIFCVLVALIITGVIKAIGRFIIRPLRKKRETVKPEPEEAAAPVSSTVS